MNIHTYSGSSTFYYCPFYGTGYCLGNMIQATEEAHEEHLKKYHPDITVGKKPRKNKKT